jgi:hypothetical protein
VIMAGAWLASWFTSEFEGKALQKSGPVSQAQVEQFFVSSTALFSDVEFKKALAMVI